MAIHLMTIVALRVIACVSSVPISGFYLLASSDNTSSGVLYQSCSEALAAANQLPLAEVRFPEKAEAYIDSVTIVTNVTISGQASALDIRGTVRIDSSGFLIVRNLTLLSSTKLSGITSDGGLSLEEATVSGWANSVITITRGVLSILNTTVEMNSGLLAKLEEWTEVDTCGVVFRSNSGGFLAGKSSAGRLRISRSNFFANSREAVIQLNSAGRPSALTVTIEDCDFAYNSAVLLDLRSLSATWTLRGCEFSFNSNTAVQVVNGNSSGLVEGCRWRNSSGTVLELAEFQGEIAILNSAVSYHSLVPAVSISNREVSSGCRTHIANSTFQDSTVEDVSFLRIYQCGVEIRNCTLSNITINGLGTGDLVGVVSVTAGNLLIADSEFRENSVQYGDVNTMFSGARMSNVSFINSEYYSTNFSMFFVGSQASLTDLRISHTSAVPVSFETIAADRISFIVIEVSQVHLTNLRVSGPSYAPAVFGISYSTLTGSGVEIEGLKAMLVFYLNKASVNVKGLTCHKCELLHLLQGSGVQFTAEDIHLTHSSFAIRVILIVGLSSLEIERVHMENVTTDVFATCGFSNLTVSGLWAQGCSSRLLLSDIVLSTVEVTNVRWDGVTGALLTAESSVIAFSEMNITEVSTDNKVAAARSSIVTFSEVHIDKVRCQSLAVVSQQSSITFRNVSIYEQRAVAAALIKSHSSAVVVEYSEFANFSSCLIAAHEGSVALRFSAFRSGGIDAAVAWEFQDAYGALLQCTDCAAVEVSNSVAQDLWTAAGGVVYCGVDEGNSRVEVRNSHFHTCRGAQGGAISLIRVQAEIAHSTFENCSANARGGALYLSAEVAHSISVADSVFIGNTASEGGAIKWANAPPSLTGLTFLNNSANYGPDIASYAVSVSPGFEAPLPPGQFITVSFRLQDHYQQLVTYESTQFLSLMDTDYLTIVGISSKPASGGIATYKGVSFLTKPNSTQTLKVRYSSAVMQLPFTFENTTQITFRDCVLGEIKHHASCNPCLVGNYSLSLEDRECRMCPEGADCPGGAAVIPKAGAWATNSTRLPIAECRVPELCIGTSQNLCRDGHRGRVCEECEAGWFALVQFGCWKCPSSEWLLLLEPFLSMAFLTLYMLAQLRLGSRESQRHYALHTLIYHIELLSLLGFVRIDYPPPMQVFLHVLLSLSTTSIASLPLQCYGVGFTSHRLYGAGASFALLLLPAVVVSFRAIIAHSWDTYRTELHIAAAAVFRQIPFISCVLLLPFFNCDNGVDGVQRLVGSLELHCWNQHHYQTALLQALPIVLISLIASGAFLVWRLRTESRRKPLRPMLHSFVFQLWTLVLSISVLVQRISNSQVYLSLVALYLLAATNGLSAPHISKFLLFLSQSSFFTLIASYSLVLAYSEYRKPAFLYVAIAVNAAFLLACVRLQAKPRSEVYISQAPEPPPSQVLDAPNNSREFPADSDLVVLELEASKSLSS